MSNELKNTILELMDEIEHDAEMIEAAEEDVLAAATAWYLALDEDAIDMDHEDDLFEDLRDAVKSMLDLTDMAKE